MKHNQSLAEKQTESTFITKDRKEIKSFLFSQQCYKKSLEKFRNTNPNILLHRE